MNQISLSIPIAQSEYSRIGLKSTVFVVQVRDGSCESSVVLDDFDFQYLHEEILRELPGVHECVPVFPKRPFAIFDTAPSIENRRCQYEKYLQLLLTSPDCISVRILWVVLNLSPEASIVPRFLLRSDNLSQLEELSSHASELHRLCNVSTLLALQRCLPDSVVVLSRVLSTLNSHRMVIESNLVKALIDCSPNTRSTTALLLSVVESNPNAFFVYLQRDMAELVDSVSERPDLSHLAQALLWGAMASSDIAVSLTDKSSMTLLNALLVQGQDTETEVFVACLLCFLLQKNLLLEFREKISTIVDSIIERDSEFVGNFRCDFLLQNEEMETCVKLGAFLCKFSRNFSVQRCHQLLNSPKLGDVTKTLLAEAIIIVSNNAHRVDNTIENKLKQIEEFAKNKSLIDELVLRKVSQKITRTNNFLIEVNFEISNKGVGELANVDSRAETLSETATRIVQKANKVMAIDSRVHATHSEAMDTILRSMLEVKAHLAEIERLRHENPLLLSEIRDLNKTQLEEAQRELKNLFLRKSEFERNLADLQSNFLSQDDDVILSTLRGEQESFVDNIDKINLEIEKKSAEIDLFFDNSKMREIVGKCENSQNRMIQLLQTSCPSAILAQTAESIDSEIALRNDQLREMKSVLLKLQAEIGQFIDIIDGDEGTGDYITPDD